MKLEVKINSFFSIDIYSRFTYRNIKKDRNNANNALIVKLLKATSGLLAYAVELKKVILIDKKTTNFDFISILI